MSKETKTNTSGVNPGSDNGADLQWLDLDKEELYEEGFDDSADLPEEESEDESYDGEEEEEKGFRLNLHVILLVFIGVLLLAILVKLFFWDARQRENNEVENKEMSFETDPLDSIVPLADADGQVVSDDDLHILFFGNGFLAEDRTSNSNVVNMIAGKSGATVYNCAVPGSYLAQKNPYYLSDYPMDAFSFYIMSTALAVDNTETFGYGMNDLNASGEAIPEGAEEVMNTLATLDKEEIDVVCIWYDSSDYYAQRVPYHDTELTKVDTTSGSLEAGIKLIQEFLPRARIIVMSPHYGYAVDENGKYQSSFKEDILQVPLYIYSIHEFMACDDTSVSFVDNFYGSIYEDNADKYLADYMNPNEAGKELLAERFLSALNRFNQYTFPE